MLPWALLLAVAIGLAAGAYPALLLSGVEPAPVLASARSPGGGRAEARVREVLIGAQFVVAIVFTICTLVVGDQARFIRDADRGFRRDGLILLDNVGAVLLAQRQNEIMVHIGRPGEDGFTERVLASWGVDGHNSHTNICSSGGRTGGSDMMFLR